MTINFFSSKDSEETHTMNTKDDNVEIMMGNEADEIIEELFESLLQRYQEGLEKSVTGNVIKLHKISLNRSGSYIDYPINPKNNDDKRFQYALTVALNYQNIKNNAERTHKIKPCIDQYNWKEINFPSRLEKV